MDITSNHLDVVAIGDSYSNEGDEEVGEAGDELQKRTEFFGHPVGKSESPPFPHPNITNIRI